MQAQKYWIYIKTKGTAFGAMVGRPRLLFSGWNRYQKEITDYILLQAETTPSPSLQIGFRCVGNCPPPHMLGPGWYFWNWPSVEDTGACHRMEGSDFQVRSSHCSVRRFLTDSVSHVQAGQANNGKSRTNAWRLILNSEAGKDKMIWLQQGTRPKQAREGGIILLFILPSWNPHLEHPNKEDIYNDIILHHDDDKC